MNVEGRVSLPLGREETWQLLADPAGLAGALPDVDARTTDDADTVVVTVRPVAGLGAVPLTVRLRLGERVKDELLVVHGHGAGSEYAVDLTATLCLSGDAARTTVSWSVDAGFCGVVASAGQRVLAHLVRSQLDDAAARLAEVVSRDSVG